MLEKLYDLIENQEGEESKSVMDFLAQFAVDEKTEDAFLAAVRDTRRLGFKAGVKAVMTLLSDLA